MYLGKAISQRIFELLRTNGWSAYRLAMNSGLSTSTLDNVLHGRCKTCNFDTLLNICRAFNIEITEFLKGDLFLLENLIDSD